MLFELNNKIEMPALIKIKQLKQIQKQVDHQIFKEYKIAIVSNFTHHKINDLIKFELLNKRISPVFLDVPYSNYLSLTLNENSELKQFNPELMVILNDDKFITDEYDIILSMADIKSQVKKN